MICKSCGIKAEQLNKCLSNSQKGEIWLDAEQERVVEWCVDHGIIAFLLQNKQPLHRKSIHEPTPPKEDPTAKSTNPHRQTSTQIKPKFLTPHIP